MMGEYIIQANETLFMKYKVANLTFDGVDSPLLHIDDWDIDDPLGKIVKSRFPYGKFGWFYGVILSTYYIKNIVNLQWFLQRDGSQEYEGRFSMSSRTGEVVEWRGRPDLASYYPAPCDRLYGSAEGTFPTSHPATISYFSPDLCRPLTFTRGGENQNYWLEGDQLANSSYSEAAWCYNPQPDLVPDYFDLPSRPMGAQPNLHLPTGLINISACAGARGSPHYISLPHFYQAHWSTHSRSDLANASSPSMS